METNLLFILKKRSLYREDENLIVNVAPVFINPDAKTQESNEKVETSLDEDSKSGADAKTANDAESETDTRLIPQMEGQVGGQADADIDNTE